jgi:Ni/Fe-hydrogenase subunit HybB-like protein
MKLRLSAWQGMFYLLLATGMVLTVIRFTKGLGAVTNLSDAYPWGLWVGFDILCGVGLAAGGFTITAMVYIFNAERYKPIVRPAILTAFLGYVLVVVALTFDLGRPWNLWHPLVMWNPRSVLFEISWCVMLYTTVLALELSGIVFERLGWIRAIRIQKAFSIPLVIVGVLLSTLHQSSLGALYLIAPGKLHPLWYTPNLPLLFFASAISVGLAMVIVESKLSARAFKRQLELPVLIGVGRLLVTVLGIYGVLRLWDLHYQGNLGLILGSSYEARLFQLEYFVGILVPFGLLAVPKSRQTVRGLWVASLAAVLGFVTNRLNVSITGFEGVQGGHYVPAWSEVLITLMLVAIGFGAFSLAVKYLNVYPSEETMVPERLPFSAPSDPRAPLTGREISGSSGVG